MQCARRQSASRWRADAVTLCGRHWSFSNLGAVHTQVPPSLQKLVIRVILNVKQQSLAHVSCWLCAACLSARCQLHAVPGSCRKLLLLSRYCQLVPLVHLLLQHWSCSCMYLLSIWVVLCQKEQQ